MNNIHKLTVAAIIALTVSGASFAQSIDPGETVTSQTTPIVRVQTFGSDTVTVSKSSLDIGDLSTSALFMNPSLDVSNQFKIVSIKNADCFDITLSNATLQNDSINASTSRVSFEFDVQYARGTDSGVSLVTVTLENLQTHTQFDVTFQAVLI
jgi:hypothetical protein